MKYIILLFILLISSVNLYSATAKKEFKIAKNYFNFGDYDRAIKILKRNVLKLEDKDDKVEALKLLGASLFFKNKKEEAKKEFRELLSIKQNIKLDALIYPPPLIEFFNKIKEEFLKKNNMMRKILEEDKKKKEEDKKVIVIKEIHFKETFKVNTRVEMNPYFFSLMPFGYAQYRNNQKAKAYVFFTAETILLTGNILSYILTYSLRNDKGYYTGSDRSKAEVYNDITKYTFIALVSFIAYGAIDGMINYKPIFETKITEIKNKPVKISFLNGNLFSFKYNF